MFPFWWIVFTVFSNILLIMLLQLSQFLSLYSPPPSTPHSLRQTPHHCSCPGIIHMRSPATPFLILYFTLPWLFCNYLFVFLNPLTSSLLPLHIPTLGNNQNALCIHDSASVCFFFLFCFLCFLDSIVDRYVFIATLLFIVLIFFFFLNKSL